MYFKIQYTYKEKLIILDVLLGKVTKTVFSAMDSGATNIKVLDYKDTK